MASARIWWCWSVSFPGRCHNYLVKLEWCWTVTFVAGALFGEVGASLFVAGAAFNEILGDIRITSHRMTSHLNTSHIASHHITWHDMTWHLATNGITSSHLATHWYDITTTEKQPATTKNTTTSWNSRLVQNKNSGALGWWPHPYAHRPFSPWNFRPSLTRKITSTVHTPLSRRRLKKKSGKHLKINVYP